MIELDQSLTARLETHRQHLLANNHLSLRAKISNFMDRVVYKDEQEYLENPDLPMELRLKLVEDLSRLWDKSGYHKILVGELAALINNARNADAIGKPIAILDIGFGGGGLIRAIYHWSMRKKIPVHLSGLDLSKDFVQLIQEKLNFEEIPAKLFQANACDLKGFQDNSVDFVISSAMLHHIRNADQVASFFREVHRIARIGWLIVDLDRRFWGPLFNIITSTFFITPMPLIRDGIKSFRRAYKTSEINFVLDEIRKSDGLQNMTCQPHPVFPFWSVKGIKNGGAARPL